MTRRPVITPWAGAALSLGWLFCVPLVGGQSSPTQVCSDAAGLMARVRAAAGAAGTDLRARLLTSGPGVPRSVLQLRIRAKRDGNTARVLIDVTDPLSHAGTLLLVAGHTGQTATMRAPAGWTAAVAQRPDGAPPWDWLSPCLGDEDLTDLHLWWTVQVGVGAARIQDRFVCVVRSEADQGTSHYRTVTSWIDVERLIPLRAEKIARKGETSTRFIYGSIHRRDDLWAPKVVDIVSDATGCRSQLTVLRGTARARLDDRIFDPARLGGLNR
jgi:hypothetical protein